MIVILKPLFELLTGDIVICNNIIFNYLSLVLIGEFAYRFAFSLVGSTYHSGLIEGSIVGSFLHWFLRLLFYILAAYFLRFCIWAYSILIAIPSWVWWTTGVIFAVTLLILTLVKALKNYKRTNMR